MAQPATTRNVLTALNERLPSACYWQLTRRCSASQANGFRTCGVMPAPSPTRLHPGSVIRTWSGYQNKVA